MIGYVYVLYVCLLVMGVSLIVICMSVLHSSYICVCMCVVEIPPNNLILHTKSSYIAIFVPTTITPPLATSLIVLPLSCLTKQSHWETH